MTPDAQFLLLSLARRKVPGRELARKTVKVLVQSSGGFCRQPLEKQQIERRRLADQPGQ